MASVSIHVLLPSRSVWLRYKRFPQKHSGELWSMSQVGYTLVCFAYLLVLLLFALHFFVLVLSVLVPFFWFLFLLSLSPHKGLKNLLLQATQVEWRLFCCLCLGVYYVRYIGVGGWYSTKAYLVLFKMVPRWDIHPKQNSCKTRTLLIDWSARHHKTKRLAYNWKDMCTHTPSQLLLWKVWTNDFGL